MQAALKLFACGHYHTTTIPDIAKLASVGEGTIYHYFRCKSDLAAAIYCENTRACQEQIRAAAAAGGTARQKLDGIAHYLLRKAELEPDLVRFVFLANRSDYLPQNALREQGALEETVAEILRDARTRGEVRDLEADLLALAWMSVIQGAMQQRCEGRLRRSLVSLAEHLCQCAWGAVRR